MHEPHFTTDLEGRFVENCVKQLQLDVVERK
jgi:hypothetical protein